MRGQIQRKWGGGAGNKGGQIFPKQRGPDETPGAQPQEAIQTGMFLPFLA